MWWRGRNSPPFEQRRTERCVRCDTIVMSVAHRKIGPHKSHTRSECEFCTLYAANYVDINVSVRVHATKIRCYRRPTCAQHARIQVTLFDGHFVCAPCIMCSQLVLISGCWRCAVRRKLQTKKTASRFSFLVSITLSVVINERPENMSNLCTGEHVSVFLFVMWLEICVFFVYVKCHPSRNRIASERNNAHTRHERCANIMSILFTAGDVRNATNDGLKCVDYQLNWWKFWAEQVKHWISICDNIRCNNVTVSSHKLTLLPNISTVNKLQIPYIILHSWNASCVNVKWNYFQCFSIHSRQNVCRCIAL